MKIGTFVSAYPFYNFRYLKLLGEFSKRFGVYVFAGSTLGKHYRVDGFRLLRVLPFRLPRRIGYLVGSLSGQVFMGLADVDLYWFFDTASPLILSVLTKPVVLDVDDPKITLPYSEKKNVPRFTLARELQLLKNKRVAKIVVPTEMIRDKFVMNGVDYEKIEVIPYGVDTDLFTPSPLPDDPVVLYYGTFQHHRSRLLVDLVEALARKRGDVRFILVGDMPPSVRRRLERFVGGRAEMPGFVTHDELPSYIQRARVCILPQGRSLGGRLSFKLLEYMACGRPVVSTDVDESFPVKKSGAGIVTPVDAEAMADAIIDLLDDDTSAKQMAEKGINYAKQFDWHNMVDKYVNLFKQVAEK